MNVSKFFHELPMISYVEVVIAWLPEVLGPADPPPRHSLLERLDSFDQGRPRRFIHQQMHMFRHDHISVNAQPELAAHPLQRQFKSPF